jgi:hypothetical protein
MFRKFVRFAAFAALCGGFATTASAANSASQNFKVVVPQSISITAPAAVSLTHDETDNPQAFQPQPWVVRGNSLSGVNVTFATSAPFTHATDSTFKRDAKLNLALGTVQGPATWTVDVNNDQTDYINNDNAALVSATSNGVGRATFNLSVTFVTEEFGVFAAGDYLTTVVGTVTAN